LGMVYFQYLRTLAPDCECRDRFLKRSKYFIPAAKTLLHFVR